MEVYGRVYGLHDPTTGELRYIGQTIHALKQRMWAHISPSVLARPKHLTHWLKQLLQLGIRPEIRLRAEAVNAEELDRLEIEHIAQARVDGHPLTNLTDGGLGPRGRKQSESHIRKLRSPEVRAKISASKRGRTLSEEHRAKIGAALQGKDQSHYTRRSGENHHAFRDDLSTDFILKRLSEGAFKAEIARELGVAHTFVHRRVALAKRAGLTDGRRNKSAIHRS